MHVFAGEALPPLQGVDTGLHAMVIAPIHGGIILRLSLNVRRAAAAMAFAQILKWRSPPSIHMLYTGGNASHFVRRGAGSVSFSATGELVLQATSLLRLTPLQLLSVVRQRIVPETTEVVSDSFQPGTLEPTRSTSSRWPCDFMAGGSSSGVWGYSQTEMAIFPPHGEVRSISSFKYRCGCYILKLW